MTVGGFSPGSGALPGTGASVQIAGPEVTAHPVAALASLFLRLTVCAGM